MPAKRRPRAKRAPAPVYRLRPAGIDAQLKDVRAFMAARAAAARTTAERTEWADTERTNLVHVRDVYGPEVWPDDAEVLEERAQDVAVLEEYARMLE